MRALIVFLTLGSLSVAGPFAPAAGSVGSTAIHKDSSNILFWASAWTNYNVGSDADAMWQTPNLALGKAVGDSFDVVSLGRGGTITLSFDAPLADGPGFDFVVFENAVTDNFLELAFVEVSSDGTNFVRIPNTSLTTNAVDSYGYVDPTEIDGLAGKYRQGYGTPFDLSLLASNSLVDIQHIEWIRLVDIVGDGTQLDSQGNSIYDPTPTIGSAGFDLDAIGVLNYAVDFSLAGNSNGFELAWFAVSNLNYEVQACDSLGTDSWTSITNFSDQSGWQQFEISPTNAQSFYRIHIAP